MLIRERTEEIERSYISPYGVLSENSLGRIKDEEKCPLRTCFQRDRDRIVHSKSFRRLKHKTQVFLSPEGDHYRTRLTHTLEVSQIARTIARALRLNEDLTEAIALGHDLGHTPFGHAGERALREVSPIYFDHNKQSVRVAEYLERDGVGLNLTKEVLDGMENHTWEGSAFTLEGQIVCYADVIAYINHDIDDAIRGSILNAKDLPSDLIGVLGDTHSKRLTVMINAVIDSSFEKPIIDMKEDIKEATLQLKDFMFKNVYINSDAKKDEGKAASIVKQLYRYFTEHFDKIPDEYKRILENEGVDRAVTDYVSSMTDRYAVAVYSEIYIPKTWNKL